MYDKNKIILIVLPGVPSEMESMLNNAVLPIIEKKIKLKISSINIRTTGLPESVIFENIRNFFQEEDSVNVCLLYTSPSPRDRQKSRMPSSA